MSGLARKTDPATSQDAAAGVNSTKLEAMILMVLRAYGPKTMHDVAAITGKPLVTLSPRFAPLRRKGLIHEAGRTGRRTIWVAARVAA
jgi:predicted transcriptional regulator